MLGIMDGKGRPNRKWIDDIKEDLYSLTISAQNRKLWKQNDEICVGPLRDHAWIIMMMKLIFRFTFRGKLSKLLDSDSYSQSNN